MDTDKLNLSTGFSSVKYTCLEESVSGMRRRWAASSGLLKLGPVALLVAVVIGGRCPSDHGVEAVTVWVWLHLGGFL